MKKSDSFNIHIPSDVEAKIRHLCSVVHDVEWSGTLFYKYSGSLDDGTFEVTCVDLYVMDIGSSAYTEFKESADVISYRIANDLLDEDIMEGLIHSHNNMATFFSGTDQSTLVEEGTNSNHFVSLIVNNAGVYTAAVTRRVITESKIEAHLKYTETKYYNTFNDEKVVLEQDNTREEDKETVTTNTVIEYFNLNIVKEEAPYPFQDIDTRLSEIKRNKARTYVSNSKWNTGTKKESSGSSKVSYPRYPSDPNYPKYGGYPNYPYDTFDDYDDVSDGAWFSGKSTVEPKKSVFPAQKEEKEETQKEKEMKTELIEMPLCLQEDFDKDLTKYLCLQLLTGSIIINEKSIDPKEWVNKMDSIYEKRFGFLDTDAHPTADDGTILDNNTRLEDWVQGMVEFLVYTRDEDLISRLNIAAPDPDVTYDESDTAEVCAYCMVEYLKTLPTSYVKEVMIHQLNTYIPDGVKDYI